MMDLDSILGEYFQILHLNKFPDARRVNVTPMDKLPDMIKEILLRHASDIKMKQCYDNAHAIAKTHKDIYYVEGYAVSDTTGIPLEHAWNVYKNVYFDPTSIFIFDGNAFGGYLQIGIITDPTHSYNISKGLLRMHSFLSRKYNIKY